MKFALSIAILFLLSQLVIGQGQAPGLNGRIVVSAQKSALPKGLTQNSSVEELIQWLDENAFPKVWIGVETEVSEDQIDATQVYNTALSEEVTLSQGFRLQSLDACKLTLRNEDLRLLELWTGNYNMELVRLKDVLVDPDSKKTFYGELVIQLSDLSLKKGRKPFRHTRKPEKAKMLGTWRMMFRVSRPSFFQMLRGEFRHGQSVLIGIRSHQDDQFYNSLWGETLRFTFDEENTSKEFYLVFRRAIELCSK